MLGDGGGGLEISFLFAILFLYLLVSIMLLKISTVLLEFSRQVSLTQYCYSFLFLSVRTTSYIPVACII